MTLSIAILALDIITRGVQATNKTYTQRVETMKKRSYGGPNLSISVNNYQLTSNKTTEICRIALRKASPTSAKI